MLKRYKMPIFKYFILCWYHFALTFLIKLTIIKMRQFKKHEKESILQKSKSLIYFLIGYNPFGRIISLSRLYKIRLKYIRCSVDVKWIVADSREDIFYGVVSWEAASFFMDKLNSKSGVAENKFTLFLEALFVFKEELWVKFQNRVLSSGIGILT